MTRSKVRVLMLAVAGLLCLPFQSQAGYNIFLSLTGIPGQATNGLIAVESFSLGLASPGVGSKPSFSNLSIQKTLDISSPLLALTCAKATSSATAILTVVDTTSGNTLYTVTLSNFNITSDQVSGSEGGQPSESVSFGYTAIVFSYEQQDGSGNNIGSPVSHNWNLTTNTGS